MPAADVSRAAAALKGSHAALLAGEPSTTQTMEQRKAVDALDAARTRLQGGERHGPDQLALDLRVR